MPKSIFFLFFCWKRTRWNCCLSSRITHSERRCSNYRSRTVNHPNHEKGSISSSQIFKPFRWIFAFCHSLAFLGSFSFFFSFSFCGLLFYFVSRNDLSLGVCTLHALVGNYCCFCQKSLLLIADVCILPWLE